MAKNGTKQPRLPRTSAGRDDILITLLAAGATYREAASKTGLSERQVKRKMDDADFRSRVDELRNHLLLFAYGRLCEYTRSAVDKLNTLVSDLGPATEECPQGVSLGVPFQVQAQSAKTILELCLKTRDSVELERRVRALEERLAAGGVP